MSERRSPKPYTHLKADQKLEMDIDNTSKAKGEGQGKAIVVILVGAPGSGKSTFCEHVMGSSTRPWVRVCQDTINNGKCGTKSQCLGSATSALKDGKSVFIDRCNLDREQRGDFVKLGGPQVDVHAVMLDLPAQLCISRSVKRTGHEGNLQGGKAAAVVNRMLQKKELPKLNEGFTRITFCQNENDVRAALSTYSALGPLDTLPNGCFGQKNPDAKIQVGIMKFLKKVEVPANPACKANSVQDYVRKGPENVSSLSIDAGKDIKKGEDLAGGSVGSNASLNDVPTLAFPSISTADFQFNHEKAADIIVEKVEEFVNKLGNARLVLVDLTHKSKILSLVRGKVAQGNIDSNKFLTFVGDITRLYSEGGLRCNVIANAANWRLKPGGGGVNAAIFSAAGPALEVATKERAKSLLPGNAVVVPLPSTSPLFSREGVTHVIHVLGPSMNPQRPNCLDNDYIKGCKILREAYTSLFEAFASIVRTEAKLPKGNSENLGTEPSELQNNFEGGPRNHLSSTDQKIKREGVYETERNKKSRGSPDEAGADTSDSMVGKGNPNNDKNDGSMTKAWGSWAQALFHIAMHPESHKDDVLEILDDVVVLNDLYPKAQRHLLVLARPEGLDSLADVCKEHLQLLRTMHAVGLKWAQKFLCEDASLVFRLGYHLMEALSGSGTHVTGNVVEPTTIIGSHPIPNEEQGHQPSESRGSQPVESQGSQPVESQGSQPNVSTETTTKINKMGGGRKRSIVWDHFTRLPCEPGEKPRASCNYCGANYACDPKINGTKSLLVHINSQCKKYPLRTQVKGQSTLGFKVKTEEGDGSGHLVPMVFSVEACRKALAEMIILDELPFRFVEGEGFKRLMHVVQPKWLKIPSRITIAKDCLEVYINEKKALRKALKGQRICLTTDTWTSVQNLNYMCLTAHYIDCDWKIHKKILNFYLVANHKGETLGKTMEMCLLEWGLLESVLTITVDNASSNNGIIQLIKRNTRHRTGTILEHEFLHVRCCVHILNLIVCEGLKIWMSPLPKCAML